jgi:WD40 repeat protein
VVKRITANAVLCAALCLQANASLLREISLPGAEVVAMAFSPSGDSLAVVFDQGNQMGALAVFPLGGRKAESRWDGIPQPGEGAVHMGEVRWSSDGHGLASRSGHELRFADLQTGKSCHVSLAPGSDPYLGGIMEASRIAVISYRQQGVADSHQVSFYDSNCQLVGAAPFADALAAAGQREMIACSTAGIRWLDTAGRFVRELKLPPEACQSIALAGNGGIFCVSTNRRAVVCRDAQSGAEAGLWPGTFRGELVAVSSGARRVALRSHKEIQLPFTDATIQPSWTWLVWDFSNGKQVGSVNKTGDLIPRPVHRSPPRAALSSDGKVMALGEDAKIKLYQIE